MNIQESRAMQNQLDATLALIRAITSQLDRIEERLAELEMRRGPGRPPKTADIHAA